MTARQRCRAAAVTIGAAPLALVAGPLPAAGAAEPARWEARVPGTDGGIGLVMVLDSSGSMADDDGTGRTRMEARASPRERPSTRSRRAIRPACASTGHRLAKEGVGLRIDTVGFQEPVAAREQLECIARAGKGRYCDAPDAAALARQPPGCLRTATASTASMSPARRRATRLRCCTPAGTWTPSAPVNSGTTPPARAPLGGGTGEFSRQALCNGRPAVLEMGTVPVAWTNRHETHPHVVPVHTTGGFCIAGTLGAKAAEIAENPQLGVVLRVAVLGDRLSGPQHDAPVSAGGAGEQGDKKGDSPGRADSAAAGGAGWSGAAIAAIAAAAGGGTPS
ncbi:hypothetical protein [Streptomyces sp. ISL-10]|uniref:hypothetical protein n=1 Tax=Streptomyces sp. ISL-10 TaxID=2819172 RepID=UPI002035C672|nr:hypothetical protein [Streptomyces sp. ISL-10]